MHRVFAVLLNGTKGISREYIRDNAIWKTEEHIDKVYDWREEDGVGRFSSAEPYNKYEDKHYVVRGTDEDFDDILTNLAVNVKLEDIENQLPGILERLGENDIIDPEYLTEIAKHPEDNLAISLFQTLLRQISDYPSFYDQFYSGIQDTFSLTKFDKEYIEKNRDDVALVLFDYHC